MDTPIRCNWIRTLIRKSTRRAASLIDYWTMCPELRPLNSKDPKMHCSNELRKCGTGQATVQFLRASRDLNKQGKREMHFRRKFLYINKGIGKTNATNKILTRSSP